MGFIANIISKLQENEVRSRMRSLYNSLTTSIAVFEKKYPNQENQSDYFKMALEARSHWKKINEQAFQYQRYGETRETEIQIGDSPSDIIKKIATIEIQVAGKGLSSKQVDQLVTIGLEELDKLRG